MWRVSLVSRCTLILRYYMYGLAGMHFTFVPVNLCLRALLAGCPELHWTLGAFVAHGWQSASNWAPIKILPTPANQLFETMMWKLTCHAKGQWRGDSIIKVVVITPMWHVAKAIRDRASFSHKQTNKKTNKQANNATIKIRMWVNFTKTHSDHNMKHHVCKDSIKTRWLKANESITLD